MEDLNSTFRARPGRFWGIMMPLTVAFMAVQVRLGWWGLRVFHPKVAPLLHVAVGYGAPLLGLLALSLAVAVYKAYVRQSFEIQPGGLLVRGGSRSRKLLWEDVVVLRGAYEASFFDGQTKVRAHLFFIPELNRLCDLVELAHRQKRSTTPELG